VAGIVKAMRTCSICKTEKTFEEFNSSKCGKFGLDSRCKPCSRERQRSHRRGKGRRWWRTINLRRYGITERHYVGLLRKQNGVCAICGTPPNGRLLAVDHDHNTGKVRGLLCQGCNAAIGYLMDDPVVVRKAAEYLEMDYGVERTTIKRDS
jgi:hypothetical protein